MPLSRLRERVAEGRVRVLSHSEQSPEPFELPPPNTLIRASRTFSRKREKGKNN